MELYELFLKNKWMWITIIIGILTAGAVEITDRVFDRLEHMQQVSRQVIEK